MLQLLTQVPAQEVTREGWANLRTAPALRGAILDPTLGFVHAFQGLDEGPNGQVFDAGLWHEPSRGVVALLPSSLQRGAMDDPLWDGTWVTQTQLRYAPSDLTALPQNHLAAHPVFYLTNRPDREEPLSGIAIPFGYEGLPLEGQGLIWAAETQFALHPNEGFSLYLQPFGNLSGTEGAQIGIGFGSKWYMELDEGLGLSIWHNAGTQSEPRWILREQLPLRGGKKSDKPIQITVVPWGMDAITFFHAETVTSDFVSSASFATMLRKDNVFECRRHGIQVPWSGEMNQFIKTTAAPLQVALPEVRRTTCFGISRVRYRACGAAFEPERLDEPKPHAAPALDPIGFWDQRLNTALAGASVFTTKTGNTVGARLRNQDGTDWDTFEDTQAVAELWLRPSADGVYSPELWALEFAVPAHAEESGLEEADRTESLVRVSGHLDAQPEASAVRIWTHEAADQVLESGRGRIRLLAGETPLFEGHVVSSTRSLSGPIAPDKTVPLAEVVYEARDLWEVADRLSASFFTGLAGSSYSTLIRLALERMGVAAEDMEIDPELAHLWVEGFAERSGTSSSGSGQLGVADDWKVIHENASIGDLLRTLIRRSGLQGANGPRPLRVICRGSLWKAYLSPSYEGEHLTFFLDDSCLDSPVQEVERWSSSVYKVLGQPEFGRRNPRFNNLRCYGVVGSGIKALSMGAYIAPDPGQLTDPSHPHFDPRLQSETLGPPDTALASTPTELERMARWQYDAHGVSVRTCVLDAEWQPGVDVDQFVVLLGLAPFDSGPVLAGERVSYGVWRVESVGYDLSHPGGTGSLAWAPSGDQRFRWRARYVLSYVGPSDLEGFPMLSGGW